MFTASFVVAVMVPARQISRRSPDRFLATTSIWLMLRRDQLQKIPGAFQSKLWTNRPWKTPYLFARRTKSTTMRMVPDVLTNEISQFFTVNDPIDNPRPARRIASKLGWARK